ncbi:hypothetical protein CBL_01381 [Carabus blaptoides fortunei]
MCFCGGETRQGSKAANYPSKLRELPSHRGILTPPPLTVLLLPSRRRTERASAAPRHGTIWVRDNDTRQLQCPEQPCFVNVTLYEDYNTLKGTGQNGGHR